MILLRADDFANKNVFQMIVEEAQQKGIIAAGPIAWDEKSIVNLEEVEIAVLPVKTSQPGDCGEPMYGDMILYKRGL